MESATMSRRVCFAQESTFLTKIRAIFSVLLSKVRDNTAAPRLGYAVGRLRRRIDTARRSLLTAGLLPCTPLAPTPHFPLPTTHYPLPKYTHLGTKVVVDFRFFELKFLLLTRMPPVDYKKHLVSIEQSYHQ